MKECVLLQDAKEEGKEVGKEVGLKALINSLKPFIADINSMLETVRNNEGYEDITLDKFEKYWN